MPKPPNRATWTQRWLVRTFTVLFAILSYWLLGYILNDLGKLPGPDHEALRKQMVPAEIQTAVDQINQSITEVQSNISAERTRQSQLRDSTANAQTTMNQLLDFQRLSLEKGVTPTEQEQLALAESQQRFLSNQTKYQELSEQISQLQEQEFNLQRQLTDSQESLREAERPYHDELSRLHRRHQIWTALMQLAVLTPLLIVSATMFFRWRNSPYVPLYGAFALAVGVKAMEVMHEYFPSEYFKYILAITFLIIVTRALIGLIRTSISPAKEQLLKQFREAYESFLCPVCAYPIRRGPLKYLFWTRNSIKKLQVQAASAPEPETAYCCPACSTKLYEKCDACGEIRHTLLPTCEHCGQTHPTWEPTPDAPATGTP